MIRHWPDGVAQRIAGTVLPGAVPSDRPVANLDGTGWPRGCVSWRIATREIAPIDGISIAGSFSGQALNREKPLFFQFGGGKAVHDGDWKLVRRRDAPWELHDLTRDRTEMVDLADQFPDRAAAMESSWDAWHQEATRHGYTEKKGK